MQSVTSRSNPVVARFRELADHPDRGGLRLLLDGTHLVEEASRAGFRFEDVLVSATHVETGDPEGQLATRLDRAGHRVTMVSEAVLRAASPVKTPSGLVAIALRDQAPVVPLAASASPLLLALADVQDPGNLGALVRVAEAAGCQGILICGDSAHPYSWRALRGSMGSLLRMPVAVFSSASAALDQLRASGIHVVATAPRGGLPPDAIDWTPATALFLGGEGPGLSADVRTSADGLVTIPMTPPVESLNVSVAGAILLYAARRQRS